MSIVKRACRVVAVCAGLAIVASGITGYAQGGNGNPGVLPPNSKAFGMTYGEWSAMHWKWSMSIPADAHPLTDTAPASTGQGGKVWFIGGQYASVYNGANSYSGVADRNADIPVGTALFFPVLDAEASTIEGNGSTYAELLSSAQWLMDHVQSMYCEVDGVPIKNLWSYRKASPMFTLGPLPDPNLMGQTPGETTPSVSDGVFIMLAPMSRGSHTLHFGGTIVIPEYADQDGNPFQFTLDITYHLNFVQR